MDRRCISPVHHLAWNVPSVGMCYNRTSYNYIVLRDTYMSRVNPTDLLLAFRGLMATMLSYSAVEGRRLGLSLLEIAVLEHLQSVGELTPGQIGERLAMSSGTVTGLLDRLERGGYLERVRHPQDRRSVVVRPRGPSTTQVQHERGGLSQELYALAAGLSEAERAVVAAYLRSVAETISRHQREDAP